VFEPDVCIPFPMRIGDGYRFSGILPSTIADEGTRLGLSADQSRHIVDDVLSAVPGALEAARQDVEDVPGGKTVADTVISNLRAISPLYPKDAPILLTSGPLTRPTVLLGTDEGARPTGYPPTSGPSTPSGSPAFGTSSPSTTA
jgi:hypothetical protein